MKRDLFDSIEVPTEELDNARNKAIFRGIQEQQKKKRRPVSKLYKVLLPVAAVTLLTFSLGFVSEPIAKAVSSIPIIGETLSGFYEAYAGERQGNADELPEPGEITETSIVAEDEGITIEIIGAYNNQDGTIGIFFEASGDTHISTIEALNAPPSGFEYYLFDDSSGEEEGYFCRGGQVEKVDGNYVGNLEIEFDDEAVLESLDTIPLTFTYMCGKEGEWSFEIPIVDNPNTVDLDKVLSEHGVNITFDSIYNGDEGATLYYSVEADLKFNGNDEIDFVNEDESIQFAFTDEHGSEIPISDVYVLMVTSDSGKVTYSGEVQFAEPIPNKCEKLTVNVDLVTETGEEIPLSPVVLELK